MRRHAIAMTGIVMVILFASSIPASAATITHDTRVRLRAPGTVAPNTEIQIAGELMGDKRTCVRRSTVSLVEVGVGLVDSTVTGRRGRFSFEMMIHDTTTFRVRFAGKVLDAVHQNNHVCERSSSAMRVQTR